MILTATFVSLFPSLERIAQFKYTSLIDPQLEPYE